MKNIFKVICFVLLATIFSGCPKDDEVALTPPRPFAEQKVVDEAAIEEFLLTHYLDSNNEIQVISSPNQIPLKNRTDILNFKEVVFESLTYKLYYLKLDEGWSEGDKPTILDSTFVSYKGTTLDLNVFEVVTDPVWLTLDGLIKGWAEIVPLFSSGRSSVMPNGVINYEDFGNVIMIIPSAFGYYSVFRENIPAYSPLVFSIQLKKVRYRDHDLDKILTKDELYNDDGSFRDTDGDGILDCYDQDDDGDGFLTKTEITKPIPFLGSSLYYPYDPIIDNPLTPLVDESEPKGIPSISGDGVTPTRLRRHLDKNAKPPYTTY